MTLVPIPYKYTLENLACILRGKHHLSTPCYTKTWNQFKGFFCDLKVLDGWTLAFKKKKKKKKKSRTLNLFCHLYKQNKSL